MGIIEIKTPSNRGVKSTVKTTPAQSQDKTSNNPIVGKRVLNDPKFSDESLHNAASPKKIGIISAGGVSNEVLEKLEEEYSDLFKDSTFETYFRVFNPSSVEPKSDVEYHGVDDAEQPEKIIIEKQTDLHSFSTEPGSYQDYDYGDDEFEFIEDPVEPLRSIEQTETIAPLDPSKPIGTVGGPERHLSFKDRALHIFHELKKRLGLTPRTDENEVQRDHDIDNHEPPSDVAVDTVVDQDHNQEPEDEQDEEIYRLRQYIFDIIENKDIVFIVSYLEDESDLRNTFEIIEMANKFNIFTIIITSLPRYFGSVENVRMTNRTLQKLRLDAEMVLLLPFFNAVDFKLIPDLISELMELIIEPGLINVDIADIKVIVKGGNVGVITFGTGHLTKRAGDALEKALSSKLLNVELGGVKKALLNVTGGSDMTLSEVEGFADQIKNRIHPGARLILGARINPELKDSIKLFVMLGVKPMQVMVNRYANE
jgi:hypothetical protein